MTCEILLRVRRIMGSIPVLEKTFATAEKFTTTVAAHARVGEAEVEARHGRAAVHGEVSPLEQSPTYW